jgi:hypothetical protein
LENKSLFCFSLDAVQETLPEASMQAEKQASGMSSFAGGKDAFLRCLWGAD